MHRQAVTLLCHLQHRVLNPPSLPDGCSYPVEFCPWLGLEPSQRPFHSLLTCWLPTPHLCLCHNPHCLGLLLWSAAPLQLPCLTFHSPASLQWGWSSSTASVLVSCLFYQMRPVWTLVLFYDLLIPLLFPSRKEFSEISWFHKIGFFGEWWRCDMVISPFKPLAVSKSLWISNPKLE